MEPLGYLLIFFAVMSFFAFVLTMYDKFAAQANRRRIPEKTLMLVAFFGGAIGMYLTMQLIRHKTMHKKFTVGVPVMILLHIAIIAVTAYFI